jgi:molybdopterin/thiamine biosynthesis adenylyltransferase
MALVLALAAGLWALGHLVGAPRQARFLMIGLLLVAVLAANVALPEGHALREATGGSAGEWLVVILLLGLAWAYSRGLGWLRARVRPENAPPRPAPGRFAEGELDRYARHVVLREIGGPGQARLKTAKVLVVGAGGLGAPAMLYLAAAGVGRIGVIDPDEVEATNLQRQVIHADARIGMPKVFSAQAAMTALNPYVEVRPYHRELTEDIAERLIGEYDLVLEGTDSIAAKYLVNRAAAAAGVPVIGAALAQWEGQIATFAPKDGAPCYACVFPRAPGPGQGATCAEAGVLGPLPGVVGGMMAVEAVKELAEAGEGLRGRMLIYDALYAETRVIATRRRPDCPVCGTKAAPLEQSRPSA